MANPYVGQLSLVAFSFAPRNWALAAGQLLPIPQNTALFSLFGTMYGGDGKATFGLPNLQGAVPIGVGQGPGLGDYTQGQTGGLTNVTLNPGQAPNHTHPPMGEPVSRPLVGTPVGNSFADSDSGNLYAGSAPQPVAMSSSAVSFYGGSQQHNNLMPFLGLYWIVALQGVYPPRN